MIVKWQSDAPKMELKVPSEIKIDGGGYPPYELPVATKEVLGGVKVDGDTINITSDGVISTQKVDLSGVATKVELEEKVSDSVKYTPQTLTDAQKKQARENVDAAGEFVVILAPDSSGGITLDKTAAQIQEAISAGKTPVVRAAGEITPYYRLLSKVDDSFMFGTITSGQSGSALNVLEVTENTARIAAQNLLITDQNGRLDQQTMAYPPTEDMHIATKKYVDDHAGGGGGEAQLNYNISSTATFTEQDKEVIKSAIKFGTGFFIDNFKVIRIISMGSRKIFVVLKPNGATDNHVVGYQVDVDADKNVTSSVFSTFIDYVLIGSNSAISGDIITSDNWETYININAGDWISTTKNDSNLYNAKQLWVIGLDGGNYYEGIYRFDYCAATTVLGDCTSVEFSLGDFTFSYDGTSLNPYLGMILAVYYKT